MRENFDEPHEKSTWTYFCESFNIQIEGLGSDDVVMKIKNRLLLSFFSKTSAWSHDFSQGNIDEVSFKAAFKKSIARAGLNDDFNNFLNSYAEAPDIEIAFDVDPEYRIVKLSDYITRKVVSLRRRLFPLEIHDYAEYSDSLPVWTEIAIKIIADMEDLSEKEIATFAAGLTHFKDYLLSENGDSAHSSGGSIDIDKAITIFGKRYLLDTRIHDELTEVEFFLSRAKIPKIYFTEITDFLLKIENFYRGEFRKSEESKRAPGERAPAFTHPLHVFRLSFGGVETARHYSDFIPSDADSFWKDISEPESLLSMGFRAGAHDVPEEEAAIQKRTNTHDLLQTLQGFYVRSAARLFPADQRADWVEEENDALEMLNAKRCFVPSTKGARGYASYVLELLELGDNVDIYLKMCDNLHNMTTAIPGNYEDGEAKPKFIQKIKDSEPLIEEALGVGFYWFMPMNTLTKVFEANGLALLAHSHAWRTVYTAIYLPRGGTSITPIKP